jgi:diacylglycerol O-acyltransferase-1
MASPTQEGGETNAEAQTNKRLADENRDAGSAPRHDKGYRSRYRHVSATHQTPKTSCLSHESTVTPSFLGFRNLMVMLLGKRKSMLRAQKQGGRNTYCAALLFDSRLQFTAYD